MIKLNVNEEKQLTFEFKIEGVNADQVTSYLRLEIDKVEYGFPAIIGKDTITVDLPALKDITNGRLKEGVETEIRLDVIADGTYLTPWKDMCKLSNPLVIEAKIVGNGFSSSPTITVTPKTDEKLTPIVEQKTKSSIMKKTKPTQKSSITPDALKSITKEGVYEYMKRAGTKSEHIQNIIYEQAQVAAKSDKPVEVLKQIVKIISKNKKQ